MNNKIGKYLHAHLLAVLVANIAIPHLYLVIFAYSSTLILLSLILMGVDINNLNNNLLILIFVCSALFTIVVCSTRCAILPILYHHLENSNCIPVNKFIGKLKNSLAFRLFFLALLELFNVLSSIPYIYAHYAYGLKTVIGTVLFFNVFSFLTVDLVGCYVVLFIWWKIRGELR